MEPASYANTRRSRSGWLSNSRETITGEQGWRRVDEIRLVRGQVTEPTNGRSSSFSKTTRAEMGKPPKFCAKVLGIVIHVGWLKGGLNPGESNLQFLNVIKTNKLCMYTLLF